MLENYSIVLYYIPAIPTKICHEYGPDCSCVTEDMKIFTSNTFGNWSSPVQSPYPSATHAAEYQTGPYSPTAGATGEGGSSQEKGLAGLLFLLSDSIYMGTSGPAVYYATQAGCEAGGRRVVRTPSPWRLGVDSISQASPRKCHKSHLGLSLGVDGKSFPSGSVTSLSCCLTRCCFLKHFVCANNFLYLTCDITLLLHVHFALQLLVDMTCWHTLHSGGMNECGNILFPTYISLIVTYCF